MPIKAPKIALLATALVGLLVLPLAWQVPNPGRQMWVTDAQNFGHTLLFFAVQWVLLWLLGPHPLSKTRLLAAAALSACLGAGIEVAQAFISRSASTLDFGLDLLGIGAATALYLAWCNKLKPFVFEGLVAIAGLTLLMGLAPTLFGLYVGRIHSTIFPTLLDFENPLTYSRLAGVGGGVIQFVPAPQGWRTANGTVLALQLSKQYPRAGFRLRHPHRDWSGFNTLKLEAYVPQRPGATANHTLKFGLYIVSVKANEKLQQVYPFTLKPGANRVALKVPASAKFNPKQVVNLSWHVLGSEQLQTVFFDNVRLY